jgi:surface carbohydrate biosynthesis protein
MLLAMKPKAIVTFIDNSGIFHWLSRRRGGVPFIAIQNGTRLRCHAEPNSGYYLQHLFSHGTHERNLFPQLGYFVQHFHPVGSLLASLHIPKTPIAETLDLLIISTWRGNIGWTREVQDTMRSMRIMDELLAGYLRMRSLRAAVISRSERDSVDWMIPEVGQTEEEYYRSLYGETVEFIETRFTERNVYHNIARAHVVVTCLSSAGLEALGLGKKVLYCNFTGTDVYHADLAADLVHSDSSPDSFRNRIDSLLHEPIDAYADRLRNVRAHYMRNPDYQPTFEAITSQIDKIIAGDL